MMTRLTRQVCGRGLPALGVPGWVGRDAVSVSRSGLPAWREHAVHRAPGGDVQRGPTEGPVQPRGDTHTGLEGVPRDKWEHLCVDVASGDLARAPN